MSPLLNVAKTVANSRKNEKRCEFLLFHIKDTKDNAVCEQYTEFVSSLNADCSLG